MLHVQPTNEELAGELVRQLEDRRWTRFRAAVAWARSTGVDLLRDALGRFLQRGGQATIVVGIDLTGTTREGLQSLLDLDARGDVEIWVYHDEAGSVFHPKVYLFTGSGEARLTVGSSNMTGGGLATNVEVSLSTAGVPGVPPMSDAEGMFAVWEAVVEDASVPETEKVVRRLDRPLLAELVAEGYVLGEEEAHAKQQRSRGRRGRDGGASRRLFGRTAPRTRRARTGSRASAAPAASTLRAGGSGRVLLMRLRRAAAARPTQVQIPKQVLDTGFFGAAPWAAYSTSGQRRPISVATASGSANTRKMEMPEVRHFADIFARFVSDGTRVTYEVHDVTSAAGAAIRQAILEGFSTSPPRSRQTSGGSTPKANSTWWLL